MGMEYRDARRSQKRAKRRRSEEERWASLAGPVETRHLVDDHGGAAEDDGGQAEREGLDAGDQD